MPGEQHPASSLFFRIFRINRDVGSHPDLSVLRIVFIRLSYIVFGTQTAYRVVRVRFGLTSVSVSPAWYFTGPSGELDHPENFMPFFSGAAFVI